MSGRNDEKKQKTNQGVTIPVELFIKRHPDHEKRTLKCMKKWNKSTTGGQQWPVEGTIDIACCDEVETNIKHPKAKDTRDKRVGKRQKERGLFGWFVQQGTAYRQRRQCDN